MKQFSVVLMFNFTSCISNNAINHLVSVDHFKKLKHFMWKYGGAMDRVDTFRISEADVAKLFV